MNLIDYSNGSHIVWKRRQHTVTKIMSRSQKWTKSTYFDINNTDYSWCRLTRACSRPAGSGRFWQPEAEKGIADLSMCSIQPSAERQSVSPLLSSLVSLRTSTRLSLWYTVLQADILIQVRLRGVL